MTLDELKTEAADVAQQLAAGKDAVAPATRKRFVAVRAELIRRGIFDPTLIRFDSATVPHASVPEIAERLKTVAANLSV